MLEIGCGTGLISVAVATYSGKFIGVDLSPNMLTLAEEKAKSQNIPRAVFRLADAYHLPFYDENFDIALITNLLHIVAEPFRVLREAHRVLRPGGFLATVTDCMTEPAPIRVRFYMLGVRLMKLIGRIKYYHFYRKSDLKDLLNANGFLIKKGAVLQEMPLNYYLVGVKEG